MNLDALQSLRADREALISELTAGGCQMIRGNTVLCGFHPDRSPSAAIFEGDDGAWRFKCHSCNAGGDVIDIMARSRNSTAETVLKEISDKTHDHKPDQARGSKAAAGSRIDLNSKSDTRHAPMSLEAAKRLVCVSSGAEITAEFRYTDPDSDRVELIVFRVDLPDSSKTFRQASPVEGGWQLKACEKPYPIYNRARVRQAAAVVIVEGEKSVHALHAVGIVATTSPCGAGKAALADWSLLAGKTVYLWPDNDKAGVDHMRTVAEILSRMEPAPRVNWLDPEITGLGPKGDAADWIEQWDSKSSDEIGAMVRQLLDQMAEPLGASAGVLSIIDETIDGKRIAVSWPWYYATILTQALLPSCVTLVCGDPGSTKSLFVLNSMLHWQHDGIKYAVLEMEYDRDFHLHRIMAILCEDSRVTNAEYIRDNPQWTKALHATHRDLMDEVGLRIWDCPDPKGWTLQKMAAWAAERAAEGCRVIAIDPITMASGASSRPWEEEQEFMSAIKMTARNFKCSIILVTHPRKGRSRMAALSMDDMAGGAAYSRFSQCIIWLEAFPVENINAHSSGATISEPCNRIMHLMKTTNGRGGGMQLAYLFEGKTFRFKERGIMEVIKPKKRGAKK